MAKADLHVHSCFSKHPSEWFLQRIGTRESYIEPEEVYRIAKAEGMDFVTITDHNTIEGALKLRERHSTDVFIGVEATTYFPEDGAKIHILVWGLNEKQFAMIDSLRVNIYDLRAYLVEQDLAHAVAHVTFSVNGLLQMEHIEKLFVLFDRFETFNGSRDKHTSDILSQVFSSLTPGKLLELQDRHFLQPTRADSWKKGETGGSDDHSGLFIGKTHTCADAATPEEFIAKIKTKRTIPAGRHSGYQGLAYAVYKVAYDFSRSKDPLATSLLGTVNSLIFDPPRFNWKKKFMLARLRKSKAARKDRVLGLLAGLITTLQSQRALSVDERLNLVSETIATASDELLRDLFETAGRRVREGDLLGLIRSITGCLPGFFLSVPFFTSLNVLNESRWILDTLAADYINPGLRKRKRILWFTDTLLELSGVSVTLQEIARLADAKGYDLKIATCLPPPGERRGEVPPNVIDFPCIHAYTPEFFNTYTLRLPSVLASLKLISEANPDEIYISTPGPLGLLGVLAARLLHLPSTAVYHTDFTRQAKQIIGDETVCRLTEAYCNWFHSLTDAVSVPTNEYRTLLERRGIKKEKLRIFRRGIDPDLFSPKPPPEFLKSSFGIEDGITLLHVGRVSKEKNCDFLAELYEAVIGEHPALNLIFAGDGPYLTAMRSRMKKHKRVVFAGRRDRADLPQLYSSSHFLVFPSVTDTFGMAVLEAQACGLPAIVSDFGGPQEIVVNGKTGFVAAANNLGAWKTILLGAITLTEGYPALYEEMRAEARRNVIERFHWDLVFEDIFGKPSNETWPVRERAMYVPFADIVNSGI